MKAHHQHTRKRFADDLSSILTHAGLDPTRSEDNPGKRARVSHDDSLTITVAIRGDLTHRTLQAWTENLPKRIGRDRRVTLSAELLPTTTHLVLSKQTTSESLRLWLGERALSPEVLVVSSEWVIAMIRQGVFLDPEPFLLSELRATSPAAVPAVINNNEQPSPAVASSSSSSSSSKSVAEAQSFPQPSETAKAVNSGAVADRRTYACIQTGDIRALNANKYITDILEELQEIYELVGDQWRSQGYKKCIGMLKQQPRITKIDQLNGIKGVGSSIREKIQEILETGSLQKLKNLKSDPKIRSLTELSGIWGVGEKTAAGFMKKGFNSVKDLRERGQHLLTRQQLIGLKHYEEFKAKIPRAEVEEIYATVKEHCEKIAPGSSCTVCGSYRRGKPQSGDVDILIAPPPGVDELPPETLSIVIRSLESVGFLTDHLSMPHDHTVDHLEDSNSGEKDSQRQHQETVKKYRASYMGVCKVLRPEAKHRRIDIKIYPQALLPFATLYFTGSDHFNRSMRYYAKKRGFSLSDKGLVYEEKVRYFPNIPYAVGQYIRCSSEEEIFAALGLPYKRPEDRNVFDVDHQFTEEDRKEASKRPLLECFDSDSE